MKEGPKQETRRARTDQAQGSSRKVILFMHMSLDGYVGRPNEQRLDWMNPDADMEIGRYLVPDLLETVDTMLLGRVLFQGFEQAWPAMAKDPAMPKEVVEFAHWIEDSPKVVFSTTVDRVGWRNSRLVRVKADQDIADAIRRLKQEPGGDMVVFGSARLAQTLARLALIDEYRFKLERVVLGSGLKLFQDVRQTKLELVKSKAFKSGVMGLYHQLAR